MHLRRRTILLLLFSAAVCPVESSAQPPDSVKQSPETCSPLVGVRPRFLDPVASKPLSWKAAVIPAGLLAYGTFAFTSRWGTDVNLFGRRWASGLDDPNRKTHLDDYTIFIPVAICAGLHIAGVPGKNHPGDAALMYAASAGLAGAIVFPAKSWTAVLRPDSSEATAFPSGHTAEAFVAAECLRQEYKDVSPWIGVAGYAAAVTTGALRMYNNRHWFSDVVAGAGVGIFSTRVTYWLYPKLKNAVLQTTGWKPRAGTSFLMPTYSGGAVGFCYVQRF